MIKGNHFYNLGAPSATKTRKDLFFSFAAHRNSITVLELPKVKITSLKESRNGQQLIGEERVETQIAGSERIASTFPYFSIHKQLLEIAKNLYET